MRPLLVGLHNPLGDDPSRALFPRPAQSAGGRLLSFIQLADPTFTERDYLRLFDRANLWPGVRLPAGRGAAAALRSEGERIKLIARDRSDVVLFGARVWATVIGQPLPPFFSVTVRGGTSFWYLPHTSGRNYIYNASENQLRAGKIVAALIGRPKEAP